MCVLRARSRSVGAPPCHRNVYIFHRTTSLLSIWYQIASSQCGVLISPNTDSIHCDNQSKYMHFVVRRPIVSYGAWTEHTRAHKSVNKLFSAGTSIGLDFVFYSCGCFLEIEIIRLLREILFWSNSTRSIEIAQSRRSFYDAQNWKLTSTTCSYRAVREVKRNL